MARPVLLKVALVFALAVFSSGCIAVVAAGGAGMVGGYALSRDTFEGVTNKSQDELWEAAYKVVSIMGVINEDRRKTGNLQAIVYGNRVSITIVPVNLTTCKLRVKARKNIFPQIGLAQEVYTKIINQLE